MSKLSFRIGKEANLPNSLVKDSFYVSTDSKKIYLNDAVWEDTENVKKDLTSYIESNYTEFQESINNATSSLTESFDSQLNELAEVINEIEQITSLSLNSMNSEINDIEEVTSQSVNNLREDINTFTDNFTQAISEAEANAVATAKSNLEDAKTVIAQDIKTVDDKFGSSISSSYTVTTFINETNASLSDIYGQIDNLTSGGTTAEGLNAIIGTGFTASNTVTKAVNDINSKIGGSYNNTNTVAKAIDDVNTDLYDKWGKTGQAINALNDKVTNLEGACGNYSASNTIADAIDTAKGEAINTAVADAKTVIAQDIKTVDDKFGSSISSRHTVTDFIIETNTTFGEIYNQIGDLQNNISDLDSKVDENNDELHATINTLEVELQNQVSGLTETIETNKTEVDAILEVLSGRVVENEIVVSNGINELKDRVTEVERVTSYALVDLDNKFASQINLLDEKVTNDLNDLDGRLKELNEAVEVHDANIDEFAEVLSEVEEVTSLALNSMSNKIDEIEEVTSQAINDLSDTVIALQFKVDTFIPSINPTNEEGDETPTTFGLTRTVEENDYVTTDTVNEIVDEKISNAVTSFTTSRGSNNVKLIGHTIGEDKTEVVLPYVTSTQAGMMTASMYNLLLEVSAKLDKIMPFVEQLMGEKE